MQVFTPELWHIRVSYFWSGWQWIEPAQPKILVLSQVFNDWENLLSQLMKSSLSGNTLILQAELRQWFQLHIILIFHKNGQFGENLKSWHCSTNNNNIVIIWNSIDSDNVDAQWTVPPIEVYGHCRLILPWLDGAFILDFFAIGGWKIAGMAEGLNQLP